MSHAATSADSPPAEAPEATAKPKAEPKAKAEPKPKADTKAKTTNGKGTKAGAKAKAAESAAPEARSAAEIKADIDAAQARLASRVDELSERLSPEMLAEGAIGRVKGVFMHEDGSPKAKPIAIAAGTVTTLLVLRKIFHR